MSETKGKQKFDLPSAEKVQAELSKAESMDDFFGKDGIFAKLFANTIEGYNRQLRKVIKNKASFPTVQSVRKILYLANHHITKKWTMPLFHWSVILNQLAIRFEDRVPL